METEYLLDACIVISFQQAGLLQSLCDAADRIPMTLVEEVYLELTAPRKTSNRRPHAKPRRASIRAESSVSDF